VYAKRSLANRRNPANPSAQVFKMMNLRSSIVLFMAVIFSLGVAGKSVRHIVLPNPKLIGCKGLDCTQIWQDPSTDDAAVYPQNVSIDVDHGAVLGITAHYDSSVSIDELRATINGRYGKWAFIDRENSPVRVWRVEPERIAIQLSSEDNGIKQVIFLSASAWDKKH
jgi:hypothetical protein